MSAVAEPMTNSLSEYNEAFRRAYAAIQDLFGPENPISIKNDDRVVMLAATLRRVPDALSSLIDRVASGRLPGAKFDPERQLLTLTIGHQSANRASPLELVHALTTLP